MTSIMIVEGGGLVVQDLTRRFSLRRLRAAWIYLAVTAALSFVSSPGVFGQSPNGQSGRVDLTQVSIEDLMNVQVTTVSKKEQTFASTGAAVFVITQEDIHRSGATDIPDVLRMAPGVEVAQVDANRWAISIRGFSASYSDKVLVLIDGRSVYLDSFSGVLWDELDVPLDDIDRIEVIRGPGGTVWGANAANGVINIITKDSRRTHGALISAGGGTSTAADSLVQYGGAIGSSGSYRAFGHYFDVNNFEKAPGQPAADGSHSSHGGFRTDWDLSRKDTLTVQGDVMRNAEGESTSVVFPAIPLQAVVNEPVTNNVNDILARWEHTMAGGSQTSLQVYYNGEDRFGDGGTRQNYNTADVDFEHHLSIGERQDVVWGLDYRFNDVTVHDLLPYSEQFQPNHRADNLGSVFLQDQIALTRSFSLTIGSKFEHNAYTGFEYEPSLQAVWTPSSRSTVWASAARAIRQPSLGDYGAQLDYEVVPLGGGSSAIVTLFGDLHPKSEQLRDFEAGYRRQITRRASVDLAAFVSYYQDLRTIEPGNPFVAYFSGTPRLIIPEYFSFDGHGRTYGGEAFVNWDAAGRLRISSGYSFLNMATQPYASSPASTAMSTPAGDSPRNQFQVRAHLGLRHNLSWDGSVAYTSPLTNVPAYTRVDSRLGWKAGEHLEFSLVGQNLTSRLHTEFIDSTPVIGTMVPRSVFAKVQCRF